jgi:hypothetical protein
MDEEVSVLPPIEESNIDVLPAIEEESKDDVTDEYISYDDIKHKELLDIAKGKITVPRNPSKEYLYNKLLEKGLIPKK